MDLRPRHHVFDAYWRFAAERQAIFFRRFRGEPPPWSDDPILQAFKFCNAYRASDRVSQFLIRSVIYEPRLSPEDTLLRIILFRLFSKIETWHLLESAHGRIDAASFDPAAFDVTLEAALDRGQTIYTNAFILATSQVFGHRRKHRNHLALVSSMMRDGLAQKVARARGLGELFRLLIQYPMIGPFMAYQLAIDINYSELTDFDEDEFTMPGPGAERGIRKCFVSTGSWSMLHVIQWMVEYQSDEFARLGVEFRSLWGRHLHAIDCQGLFCEIDKYSRAAFPELRSNRVRIKTSFAPTPTPIAPFYPPKWGLNDAIEIERAAYPTGSLTSQPIQLVLP
ncbi:MAG: nucleotide kinase domain-containing protein [Thermomicrobiales bacterium]